METQGNRTLVIAVVAGAVMLLLGLCSGALMGGLAGFMIARSSEVSQAPRVNTPRVLRVPEQATPVAPRRGTPERAAPALTPVPSRTPSAGRTPGAQSTPTGFPSSGVFVREVVQDSPAERADLQVGDVIVQVDEVSLDADNKLNDLLSGRKPGDKVDLTLLRGSLTRTITVELGSHPDDASRAYLGIRYTEVELNPTPRSTP